MAAALKYGTPDWETMYLKNRKPNPMDYKALNAIGTRFADGVFFMIHCKETDRYMTGNYPGAFRWLFTVGGALMFNGVFRTEQDAKDWFDKQSKAFGIESKDVEFLPKTLRDLDIIDAVRGKVRLG